jgi:hypothetical protein
MNICISHKTRWITSFIHSLIASEQPLVWGSVSFVCMWALYQYIIAISILLQRMMFFIVVDCKYLF